uniref:Uncharacterized protein n=1 Tax=Acrobeloides nanus TaxID=290746 RepID=A0A914EBA4_9BILA
MDMDEDLFQAFVMFAILAFGVFAAAFLVLRHNSERFNLPLIIRCLLCININHRKSSMHPTIRVAKPFAFDPEEDMENARRKLPLFDLNINRKLTIFKHHTHHHRKTTKIMPEQSIYSVPVRKVTWHHSLPIEEKHLISPTLSSPTEGASSPCAPSICCGSSIVTSSSGESYKPERRMSM